MINRSSIRHFVFITFLWSSLPLISQAQIETPIDSVKKNYFEIGLGFGQGKFRDFATSPLFYDGNPLLLNLAFKMDQPAKETYFGLQYYIGFYSNVIKESKGSTTRSTINSVDVYYQHLVVLPQFSNEKWNLKVGGQANMVWNYRYNASLQNNGVGIEMINTLFGSGKVTRDVSRTKVKEYNIWFVNIKRNPKKRKLDFQLNIGLMNNSFRNGYAYKDQSAVVNDPKLFAGYEYHWFQGFRISSSVNYTLFLRNNKNAIQFSYLWDALQTGGESNRFEQSSHVFKFSLMFNTK